jgi:hypothetical protein
MRRLATAFLLALLTSSVTVAVAWAGPPQTMSSCLAKSSVTPWGAGEIHVCAGDGQGRYYGHTTDKAADGYCVRWRIVWDNNPDTYTTNACQQNITTDFNEKAPGGASGVIDAFLEQVKA